MENGDLDYVAWGQEHCPSTGKCHHQGWAWSKQKRTISAFKAALGPKPAHIEPMKGTFIQSDKYCSKESQLEWVGTRPSQGSRTDLKELHEKIKLGWSVDSILNDDPQAFHQFGRTLLALEDSRLAKLSRSTPTIGLWLWGGTGLGKSRLSFEKYTCETHYVVNLEDKGWYENYQGQSIFIIDDFRGSISYSQLLRLTDRYPMTLPRRARQPVPFVSRLVIVTSSMPPAEVYHNLAEKDSLEQLFRRFEVFKFPLNSVEEVVVRSHISKALE